MAGLLGGALDNDMTRFGLGLLAASGPTNDPMKGAFGNRLMQAVGSYDDYRKEKAAQERAKQMQEFQAFQMEQAKSQMAAQQAAQADALKKRSIFSQNFQSEVGPSADGFGPTRPMQFDHNQAAAQLGQAGFGEDALDLMSKFAPKPADYKTVGNTLLQIGPNGPTPVFTEEKAAAPTDLAKLLAERNQLPEGSPLRRVYDQQITKMTTHQPGVNVTYGAPQAGVDAQGNPVFFQPSKDGGAPAIIPGVAPPPRPTGETTQKAIRENNVVLGKIDAALAAVDEYPNAFGLKNLAGDTVMQRADPEGTTVRAMVTDIGGQKISDRSGAAVTAAEMTRLKPYIPNDTDTAATVAKKLELFRNEYAAVQRELDGGSSLSQVSKPAQKANVMESLPSPVQHKGKTIRDTTTGKMLTSNGLQWVEAK